MGRTPVDDRGPRVVEPVRKDAFLQARVADPSDQCLNRGADGIGVGIDSCSDWHLALMDRSNFTAELCQHRNNTDTFPGLLWPNPLTRPFDTEADSDPDPDLALPLTFWDDLSLTIPQNGLDQTICPTHPHNQVENATAPSAGGSPTLVGPAGFEPTTKGL